MELTKYLKYSSGKKSPFYSLPKKDEVVGTFDIPFFSKDEWDVYEDVHWTNIISRKRDFPEQGWKIHITSELKDAQNMLYDVAQHLIEKHISFKFVPNLKALEAKNLKYASRIASGKFITVYPEHEPQFLELLDELKDITDSYDLGPYILNDQQWRESNVFFRYGGLKRINMVSGGTERLAIRTPEGELIEDERVPYYHLPDFVEEPGYVQANNTFPSEADFRKLNEFNIEEAIHYSNGGGVYLATRDGKKMILKEGRSKSGVDSNRNDAFQRNKNEYLALKKLADVEGVIDVHEYFVAWRHNYFTEEFHEGRSLRAFIAQDYPFTTESEDKKRRYVNDCKVILEQLVRTIDEIHQKGVAIGDLNHTNIMLDDALRIKIIDLEVAKTPNKKYVPSIATPGFFSNEAKDYREADWFAVYRISRLLFLPIPNVLDIAPQLRYIHDANILEQFGPVAIRLLQDIEAKVARHTKLSPRSPLLEEHLDVPTQPSTFNTLDTVIAGLHKGILNHLDVQDVALTKGNAKQYLEEDAIFKHNIAYGSFGVLLALVRSDRTIVPYLQRRYSKWFELVVPYLENYAKTSWAKAGLFEGYAGIITVLYELGFETRALNLLDTLIGRYGEVDFLEDEDVSIESGLAGIGLLLLSFDDILDDARLGQALRNIEERIMVLHAERKSATQEEDSESTNYGLLTGWSGAALFLFKYRRMMGERDVELAYEILDESFQGALDFEEVDELFLMKDDLEMRKAIPYLREGSAGITLAMMEFQKDDPSYLDASRNKMLQRFKHSHGFNCSAIGGLMNGYGGFVMLGHAIDVTEGSRQSVREKFVRSLDNYLVRNGTDEILFPGEFNLKCSMDVYSGAAGILMVLNDLKGGSWGSWFPVLHGGLNLFQSERMVVKQPDDMKVVD